MIEGKGEVKGNFTKSLKEAASFEVKPFDLSSVSVNGIAAFDGVKANAVKVTIVDNENQLIPASKFSVKVTDELGNDLTAAKRKLASGDKIVVTVTSKGGSEVLGTLSEELVVGTNLAKAKVALSGDFKKLGVSYTGLPIDITKVVDESGKNPFENGKITMSLGKNLEFGTGFEVLGCVNNRKKGTMKVVIRGIGGYSGVKTFNVKISPRDMN